MATFHTDYLLGNDTTGNGSVALPFKSIARAYSASSASDTIKVAGSTLSDVPGLTLTSNSSTSMTFTANIDPTGLIAAGDCLSLTDPVWGTDKFFFRVVAIVGTTVTLSSASLPGVAMSVRKFNQIHYATSTANIVFETYTNPPSNIQLLGGWNSDFTLQNGWTVVRYQTNTSSAFSGTFLVQGTTNNNTTERFACFSLANTFNVSGDYRFGDMIFVRVGSITAGGSSWAINANNNVKWYLTWSDFGSAQSQTRVNVDGTYNLTLKELYSTKVSASNSGIRRAGLSVNNYYIQSTVTSGEISDNGLLAGYFGGIYGNIYLNNVSSTSIYTNIVGGGSTTNTFTWNGGLYFPTNSVRIQPSGFGRLTWNNPTQNITTDFNYWANASNSAWWLNTGAIYANDIEGVKLSSNGSGFQYNDTSTYLTGNISLRNTRSRADQGQNTSSLISQFIVNSGTTKLDITITAKNDSVLNISEPFKIWKLNYLPTTYPAVLSTTQNINNNWTTWTWTITDTSIINVLKDNLCFITWGGIVNTNSTYLWVDNVVITQS